MNNEDEYRGPDAPAPEIIQDRAPNKSQWTIAIFIVVFACCVLYNKVLHHSGLAQTSLLYVGLPALLAIGLTLTPRARTTAGMALKGTTVAILLSSVVVGEGFICLIMATPLFLGVALVVSFIIKSIRESKDDGRLHLPALLVIPLAFMLFEGVFPQTTVNPTATATASMVTRASTQDVDRDLAQSVAFETDDLPAYLKLGFPKPVDAVSEGNDVGDRRTITFEGAQKRPTLSTPHHWGTEPSHLVLEVTEHSEGHLQFKVVSDHTPMSSWLNMREISVDWSANPDSTTAVTWEIEYDRLLAPAWYFGPWENYGTERAAEYLLASFDFARFEV